MSEILTSVACLYCNVIVDMNRDYKDHLNNVHNVFKNVDDCMQLAQEKLDQDKKSRVIEEITLDDDDETVEADEDTDIKQPNYVADNPEIRKLAENTADALFGGLRAIMNGTKTSEIDETIDENVNELFKDEDDIAQYFSKLKEKVRKFEIPRDVLAQLRDCNIKPEAMKAAKLEVGSNPCDICSIDFATNDELKTHMKNHENQVVNQIKREDKSKKIPKVEKRFVCPLTECSFWTDKVGMKGGKAAIHLSKDHMIKPKDMAPGKFKFNKVTVNI